MKVVLGERVSKELMEAGKGRVELKDGAIIEGEFFLLPSSFDRRRVLSSI